MITDLAQVDGKRLELVGNVFEDGFEYFTYQTQMTDTVNPADQKASTRISNVANRTTPALSTSLNFAAPGESGMSALTTVYDMETRDAYYRQWFETVTGQVPMNTASNLSFEVTDELFDVGTEPASAIIRFYYYDWEAGQIDVSYQLPGGSWVAVDTITLTGDGGYEIPHEKDSTNPYFHKNEYTVPGELFKKGARIRLSVPSGKAIFSYVLLKSADGWGQAPFRTVVSAPTVNIVDPEVGLPIEEGTDLYVKANASDIDGSIEFVQLFINGQFVRQESKAPYEWGKETQNDLLLQNLRVGTVVLEAIATDDEGLTATNLISITVSASTVEDTTPPAVPSGLSALPGIGAVDLGWTDNTEPDLASYTVYRSATSGSGYSVLATGVTASDYLDTTVVNHTTYYYVVRAVDTNSNESAQSSEVSAQPGWVADTAVSDIAIVGTISGTLADSESNDDLYQTITETDNGTTSALEHQWVFNVSGAELVTFYVEAHHSANSEGDDFVFAYSTDDVNYTDMVLVTKTADDNTVQWYALPSGLSGSVHIRVVDADRADSNTQLDSIHIDNLFIVSEESSVAPTMATDPAPANGAVDVAMNVDLSWTAGLMAASHDVYFGTDPNPAFLGNQTGTVFDPGTLLNNTTYFWAVDEVNNSGTATGPVWSFTTEPMPNNAPFFTSDPFTKADATVGVSYSKPFSGQATDPDGDSLTFSKISGPAWLTVDPVGRAMGTPGSGDEGLNSFVVRATDSGGLFAEAVMEITVLPGIPSWSELTNDDFESGWGNWVDGGADAKLLSSFAIGSQCVNLQDNSRSSEIELSSSLDLSSYNELKIEFSYVVQSFEGSEDFRIRYSSDGGSSWATIQDYVNDVDFVDDGTRYNPVLTIDSGSYSFTPNVKIKFECDASRDDDDIYIDNIVISAQ